jgi:hypothetical protein
MIVSGDDTPRILFAVEVKLSRPNGKDDKTRLETHMVQRIGIAKHLDDIRSDKEADRAAHRFFSFPGYLAEFQSSSSGRAAPELGFEEAVRSWLEGLGTSPFLQLSEFPPQTREEVFAWHEPAV